MMQINEIAVRSRTAQADTGKLDFNERCDGAPAWLQTALADFDAGSLWRYPDRAPVEAAVAQYFGIAAEQILLCNGGDEAIDLLLRFAAHTERNLLLPLPAFSMYGLAAWRNRVRVTCIAPVDNFRIDKDALLNTIAAQQCIVLTSPNNPSGELLEADFLQKVCARARDLDSIVLIDNAYLDFAETTTDAALALCQRFDNVLILRSLSKSYGMAGLRCGYLMAQAQTLAAVKKLCPPFNVASPGLALIRAAFGAEAQAEMRAYCRQIASNRDRLRDALLGFGISIEASAANFLLLPLTPLRADFVATVLAKSGIKVRRFTESADSAGPVPTNNDNALRACLRISIPLVLDPLITQLQRALCPELLCLDMDGVLLDTSASYDACICATAQSFGVSVLPSDIQNLRNRGGVNDDWLLCQQLVNERGIDASYVEIKNQFQIFYRGRSTPEKMTGLQTLERSLLDKKTAALLSGQRTAIVTGRPADEAVLGCGLLAFTPDWVLSRDDVAEMKPAPDGIIKAGQLAKAKRLWMVGDSVDDMHAAIAADAIAIGICTANEDGELRAKTCKALLVAGAACVLTSINELNDLL